MIQTNDPEIKEQVKKRLARIEGQLRGVQKMIDEERDCKEIIQQLTAISSATHAASLHFLQAVTNECLLHPEGDQGSAKHQEKIHDLIQLLGKIAA